MKDLFFLLNHIYSLYEIPIYCFDEDTCIYKTSSEISEGDPLIVDKRLRDEIINNCPDSLMLRLENSTILYGICKSDDRFNCMIGPISVRLLNGNELHHFKIKHGLLNFNDFKIKIGSVTKAASVLSLIHERLNNQQIDSWKILDNFYFKDNDKKVTSKDLYQYHFQNSELSRDHLTYQVEKDIMAAISSGDIDFLKASIKPNMIEYVGLVSKTPYKQLEYTFVSGITMFTRAAIDGGVSPDAAYQISDLYIQKIAECKTEMDLQRISMNAKLDLCAAVCHAKSLKNDLYYIEKCKRYIIKNLHKQFTLEDIASAIGMSKCYLTNQFSKHENKSLKQYTHEERIRASQNMLKYSDQSITAIANYLCFNSQSHFGNVFKKVTGMTPHAYRLKYKTASFL